MKNTNTNTETLLEQSVEKMLQSKVDMDTSDIFFNFGAVNANAMDFSEIENNQQNYLDILKNCLLYTSPSPRD